MKNVSHQVGAAPEELTDQEILAIIARNAKAGVPAFDFTAHEYTEGAMNEILWKCGHYADFAVAQLDQDAAARETWAQRFHAQFVIIARHGHHAQG